MKIKTIPYKPLLLICLFCQIAFAQFVDSVASPANAKLNRARGLNMLSEIKVVIKERYYDKTFRGIDLAVPLLGVSLFVFSSSRSVVKDSLPNWRNQNEQNYWKFEALSGVTRNAPPSLWLG